MVAARRSLPQQWSSADPAAMGEPDPATKEQRGPSNEGAAQIQQRTRSTQKIAIRAPIDSAERS